MRPQRSGAESPIAPNSAFPCPVWNEPGPSDSAGSSEKRFAARSHPSSYPKLALCHQCGRQPAAQTCIPDVGAQFSQGVSRRNRQCMQETECSHNVPNSTHYCGYCPLLGYIANSCEVDQALANLLEITTVHDIR